MSEEKENIFGSYGTSAEQRQQDQQQTEAAIDGARGVGRPRKRQNATSITLVISDADKKKVKAYAFNHSVTVSDLLHRWIEENCVD